MKFPIGIQTLEQIIEDGYVYVDKTALVYKMVSEGKVYFLSRPRRFGKSLLLSTLEVSSKAGASSSKGMRLPKALVVGEARLGGIDCVVETAKVVYIFEVKRDGTAQEALEQIEEKGYAKEYEADSRQLYKVGCNFSTETGAISDQACAAG